MYAFKIGVTYPGLLHANSRSQIVLSYTYFAQILEKNL